MAKKLVNGRKKTFTELDLIENATITCKAGQFTQLGLIKVPAGLAFGLGYGLDNAQHSALGRAYGDPQDDMAGALEGTLKFSVLDESLSHLKEITEIHTSDLRTSATVRGEQYPFEYQGTMVTRDKYIRLEFLPDGANDVTLSKANTTLKFDGTQATVIWS